MGVRDHDDGVVLLRGVLHRHQDGVALGGGDVEDVCFCLVGVDAVDFDDAHGVVFYVDVLGDEGADVDETEEVGFSCFHGDFGVEGVVEEEGVRDGLSAGGVVDGDEGRGDGLGQFVVPVCHGDGEVLVVLVGEVGGVVVHDEGLAVAIWVAVVGVAVVPVRAVLVDGEVVRDGAARRHRTLSQHGWAVHFRGVGLVHAVKVD